LVGTKNRGRGGNEKVGQIRHMEKKEGMREEKERKIMWKVDEEKKGREQ